MSTKKLSRGRSSGELFVGSRGGFCGLGYIKGIINVVFQLSKGQFFRSTLAQDKANWCPFEGSMFSNTIFKIPEIGEMS